MHVYCHSVRIGEGHINGMVGPVNLTEERIKWRPFNLLTHHFYFRRNSTNTGYDHSEVDEPTLHRGIQQCIDLGYDMQNVCLNIEAFSFGPDDVDFTMKQFKLVVGAYRDAFPGARLGCYGIMPRRSYWDVRRHYDAHGSDANARRAYHRWQASNLQKIEIGLSELMDMVQPSLYMFYHHTTAQQDRSYLHEHIYETQRVYDKPAIYWVWPCFHDSNVDFKFSYLGDEKWRRKLEVIKHHAKPNDGIVILNFRNDGLTNNFATILKEVFPECVMPEHEQVIGQTAPVINSTDMCENDIAEMMQKETERLVEA